MKIGEYHQGYILGDSLVLAGAYIQSCHVFRPIVREQKYLMDYKLNYKSNIHETVGKIKEIKSPFNFLGYKNIGMQEFLEGLVEMKQ